jgi:hypothetical protein
VLKPDMLSRNNSTTYNLLSHSTLSYTYKNFKTLCQV